MFHTHPLSYVNSDQFLWYANTANNVSVIPSKIYQHTEQDEARYKIMN